MEMCVIVVCTLIDDEFASLLFSQTFFFSRCFCLLSEFAKGFESKVWRVQVAHLHNAARQNSHQNLNGFFLHLAQFSHLAFEECHSQLCGVFGIPRNCIFFH